jgi:O-acetyl-ADP-ribose deacetylase (regulator of RNase III)
MADFQFISHGNIFLSFAEALVNPVNCGGTMGKGLAAQFKKRYPENFLIYKKACDEGRMFIGKMLTTWDFDDACYIVNFPTKVNWRNNSEYDWIGLGLLDLKEVIDEVGFSSIAIPALGCGLGGLEWSKVREMIVKNLDEFDSLSVKVYEP